LLGKLTGTLGVDNSDDWENEQAFTNLRDQPVSDFTGESKSTVDKTVIVRKSAAIRVFPGSIVSLEETLLRPLSLTSRRMPPGGPRRLPG
jgi:hypothetical protein